jgi:energy-converting hydrogenase Eha subunit E
MREEHRAHAEHGGRAGAGAPRPDARDGALLRFTAWAQGGYYLLTGVWPLVHLPSFEWVTGPKTDDWLVRTVGLLVGAVGVGLLLAARRGRVTLDLVVVAALCALALAAVDVVYVADGTLRPVYLLDALPELGLAGLWWVGWRGGDRG